MDKKKYQRLEKAKRIEKEKITKLKRAISRLQGKVYKIEKEQLAIVMADQPKLFPEMVE